MGDEAKNDEVKKEKEEEKQDKKVDEKEEQNDEEKENETPSEEQPEKPEDETVPEDDADDWEADDSIPDSQLVYEMFELSRSIYQTNTDPKNLTKTIQTNKAECHLYIGEINSENGNIEEAIEEYKQALEIFENKDIFENNFRRWYLYQLMWYPRTVQIGGSRMRTPKSAVYTIQAIADVKTHILYTRLGFEYTQNFALNTMVNLVF